MSTLPTDWGQLTTDQLRSLPETAVVLLPVGSIEQHGPHLPVATDLIIAERVCEAVCAAQDSPPGLYRLPPIPYSKSNEHDDFAGTVSLSAVTVLSMLEDIAASIRKTPVRTLVLVNGHGGNTSLLDVATRDLRIAHELHTFLIHPLSPAEHGGSSHPAERGLGVHAGYEETSLMLHLHPELVRTERFATALPTAFDGYTYLGVAGAVHLGWTARDLSESGTIGDPTLATADAGAELFGQIVHTVSSQLAEIRDYVAAARPGAE
jgi:creatinine amidohydrolase